MPPTINDQPTTTKGWVTTSYRNYKGKRLGPYHYRRWKVGSKIHRQYIKPADVERVKAECAEYSEQRRSKRETGRRINVYLDNFIFQSKMYFRYEQGKEVRPDQEAYIVRLHNEGMYIIGRPLYRPRRLFGDPKLSNFIYECFARNIDLLEAQMLSALGANIDQIERIVKSDPDSQGHKEEMQNLFAAFHKEIVASQNFGAPNLYNSVGFASPPSPRSSVTPAPPRELPYQLVESHFGDPQFSYNSRQSVRGEPSNPATQNRATGCFGDPSFSNKSRYPAAASSATNERLASTRPALRSEIRDTRSEIECGFGDPSFLNLATNSASAPGIPSSAFRVRSLDNRPNRSP